MTHWEKGTYAGSYRIDVDGKPALTNDSQFADVISQTGHPLFFAPFGILLTNLEPGAHSISIVVLSGMVEWDWIAGGLGVADRRHQPVVFVMPTAIRSVDSVYPTWNVDPSDAIATTSKADSERKIARCREMHRSMAAAAAATGLNVFYGDITGELDPAADLSADGVHPNDSGQAKLEAAALRLLQQAPR